MKIQEMFKDDINRKINGVVQVEQEEKDVIYTEIKEYVITSELKKHYISFFDQYGESFASPTDNVGAWITGFFGSGKSHFLKMLSYLLKNEEINGKKTVDYFREKFDDDLSFMNIEKSINDNTETILFNIDVEGSINKDSTAVLRVFAKVFYNHLGFYGQDLKVAKLEQFVSQQGKYEEFNRVFEEKNGASWIDSRNTMNFFEDDVVQTMVEVLGMSESASQHWFDGTENVDISIGQLVDEVKAYVNSKPKNFRLLFMIDEAGQYVGTDTSLILNLQTMIEKLGSVCRGQVWVVATGQEALDDMIKVRADEFSRIMARFPIRLSLTSSSVDEVIEKRLLSKTDEANKTLEMVYDNNDSILRNLYAFDTEVKNLKGYNSASHFARIYPFVPYQFKVLQKVLNEIRTKGHVGKHTSQGERSMLEGFKDAVVNVQDKDELSIVPFYEFYKSLHKSLDTSVRSVIENAEKDVRENSGLEEFDVNLLKLLYLVRYIDEIPSNIENLTILMADTITVDKLTLKDEVKQSLARLMVNNYIARNGELYNFLTDEEQEIARDIKATPVDTKAIIEKLGNVIFQDIYISKKFKYQKYDFDFDEAIDDVNVGNSTGGMKIRFMTSAADPTLLTEYKLIMDSKQNEAICVLSDKYPYYENMENAIKIRKYAIKKNTYTLSESMQKIVEDKQREAARLELQVKEDICKSIVEGKFYIDGEVVTFTGSDAKVKIDHVLASLVEHTYSNLTMIDTFVQSDSEIQAILKGLVERMEGAEPNRQAMDEVHQYLILQSTMKLPTSMADIHNRFGKCPYGWKEIDIAAVVAWLVVDQKVTIKKAGMTISASDRQFVDMLRKKSEIGTTSVCIREKVPAFKLKQVKDFLREYFDVMDLPEDEDRLIEFVESKFNEQKGHFSKLLDYYQNRSYPGQDILVTAMHLVENVIRHTNDNIALIDELIRVQDNLLDSKDDLKDVENFFATQKTLFDNAIRFVNDVKYEKDYFENMEDVTQAIDSIKKITTPSNHYDYGQIKNLNGYISVINTARQALLATKKHEVMDCINQCLNELELKAGSDENLNNILLAARIAFDQKKQEVNLLNGLAFLEAKKNTLWALKDQFAMQMDTINQPKVSDTQPEYTTKPRTVRTYHRQVIFPSKDIKSKQDVESYVDEIRAKLMKMLEDADEIKIN